MTPSEIKPGMKFGHWTVIKYDYTNKHRIKYFLCECDCGTRRSVRGTALLQGISTACSKACDNNLTGQRFGKLTVVKVDKNRMGHWLCNCDCGIKNISLRGTALRSGKVKSCGCYFGKPGTNGQLQSSTQQKYNSAIGQHIGNLQVLHEYNKWNFICQCDCGKKFIADKYSVYSHNTTSCGCMRGRTAIQQQQDKYMKLVGTKINQLTVLRCFFKNNTFWFECKCDCGKVVVKQATKVASKYYFSCGCVKSSTEEQFEKILLNYNINFRREYKFSNCKDKAPLPFDFAIFNNTNELLGLVELNGQQHYTIGGWNTKEHLDYVQRHDKIKLKFCCQNNIPLLVIPYQYYDELEKFLLSSDFWQIITKNIND